MPTSRLFDAIDEKAKATARLLLDRGRRKAEALLRYGNLLTD